MPVKSALSPYGSFHHAQSHIAGIEAIDYFFAKEMLLAIEPDFLYGIDQNTVFHLLLALSESLRDGHSCLPLEAIAGQRFGLASDEEGIISHHGFQFGSAGELTTLCQCLGLDASANEPLVYEGAKLFLRRYYRFEQELFAAISQKSQHRSRYTEADIQACLNKLFTGSLEEADIDWQHVAVANAINKNFSVIAGGPGTGKTYTVTKLLAALVELESKQAQRQEGDECLKISLVAPTGKAAQRLSESISGAVTRFRGEISDLVLDAIPSEAQTIHRLLGVIPNSPNFRRNENNLLDLDILLIDEVSMVDLAMMARIFRALPAEAKVILLGDADQLPSVSAGSVLADIAHRPHGGYSRANNKYLSEVTGIGTLPLAKKRADDHVTFLLKSRRFDGKGGIGLIATAVIKGQSNDSWQLLQEAGVASNELNLLSVDINDWLPQLVSRHYLPLFAMTDVKDAFRQLSRFRILCATRKGEAGVENINQRVEQLLADSGAIRLSRGFYHGQPIMISENDYRLGLYNGDIGILWKNRQGQLMAVFESQQDEGLTWIIPSRLPKFETVYAMTIHKTQGSEFDHVAMVLPGQKDNKLLSRQLLYTGITRAKKQFSLSSSASVWRHGVDTQVKRHSGLSLK